MFVLCFAAHAYAAPSAEWSLTKVAVAGLKGDLLCVDSAVSIRAVEEELRIEGWRGFNAPDAVRVDIDVFAPDGTKLPDVLGTGPAESFRKAVSIPRGESRQFLVFTGLFTVSRSGWYVARGRLQGVSAGGRVVNIPLEDIRFHVEVSEQKGPIQAPEPAPTTVTPPAGQEARQP